MKPTSSRGQIEEFKVPANLRGRLVARREE
jgi:hypothetical protein